MARQSQSEKLLQKAVGHLAKKDQNSALDLARRMFTETPPEDLKSQSSETLANVIAAARNAMSRRPKDTLIVEAVGSEHTLILAAMDDRPFIVDSMLGEINAHNVMIELIAHPVLESRVGQNVPTALTAILISGATNETVTDLKTELDHILKQVRLVTGDWRAILARVDEELETIRETPPPLPADQIAESIQFLQWLTDNNFTFLGLREYSYEGTRNKGQLKPVAKSALGILRDDNLAIMTRGGKPVSLTPEIRDFLFGDDPLIITKANVRSKVHRRTHLDYIGVKKFTDSGKLAGELRIVGLFTSTAYTKSVLRIPVLRYKANTVLERWNADSSSHSGKALINILETWPRDELFQIDVDTLSEFSGIAALLEERPRVRILARPDKFDRFVSVVAFIPRDRYDSEVRHGIGNYLEEVYDGYLSAFYPAFLENGLVRVQFIIGRSGGKTPIVTRDALETKVIEITTTWTDRLQSLATSRIEHSFSPSYQHNTIPQDALADVLHITNLVSDGQLEARFHDVENGHQTGLKLFHLEKPLALSGRVPLLENLGFHVIEESTYEIVRDDGAIVFIHDMLLERADGGAFVRDDIEASLVETINAIWRGEAEDDLFNSLVPTAQIGWKTASVFRAYARYLRQIKLQFPIYTMAKTLNRHAELVQHIAQLFDVRFNPEIRNRERKYQALRQNINQALEKVISSDDDRILRNFVNLIDATLRTNYYTDPVEGSDIAPTPVLAFKVDPSKVDIMPQPVPYREIFVSSPQVEGLHLRFGPVARGGLRWSDRTQDYRTEVLGLVKAQQVKNAVIVPVGSKGGFIPKQLPARSDPNWFEEGRSAYKVFISSLLSLTDNLVEGKVVPPVQIVRHDDDDPYFVVAADKGTSTFSDTANAISEERDFWLDDAFASGGSAGYDHKKMGITARGAWEAVKRHFREMEKDGKSWDIQSMPFTAAGVGDMSGDVFGNGMLLSKSTRLIAAFDHRDIFIDPDPDISTSYKERSRLFKRDRSSWQDYNTGLISKGGGVFSRSAKKINLSLQAADAIGFTPGDHTPQEIMNAILKAPVDLIWFGGVGTYIRASHESDADADDRGNDAIRVTANELRCRVLGEGANLGTTHPARIEFNRLGGCCNSDAIDNSAGVNSSDVEVNIKIALADAMKSGRLSRSRRNTLLESMTEDVSELVLRNNYLQTLAISLSKRRGMEAFTHQQRLIQNLEERNLLDREVEDLPDDTVMAERRASDESLTRAEIGVLLAYAKIVALDDLVASDVPDDPYLHTMLIDYFPKAMQKPYRKEIDNHRLRREITATVLANSMINRGGPTFITRVTDRTGASLDEIARAYVVVRDAFGFPDLNARVDTLDVRISGELQLELYATIQERVISQSIWFVRYGEFSKGLEREVTRYRKAVEKLSPKLEQIIPDFLAERVRADQERYQVAGVPKDTAQQIAILPIAGLLPDIFFAADKAGKTLDQTAKAFFTLTQVFRVDRMVQAARSITTTDYYDGLALDRALQSLHRARRDITIDVLTANTRAKDPTQAWIAARQTNVDRIRDQISDIVSGDQISVSRLTVAANVLGDLARE